MPAHYLYMEMCDLIQIYLRWTPQGCQPFINRLLILDHCGIKPLVDEKCPAAGAEEKVKVGKCRKCLFEECHSNHPDCEAIKTCIGASACKLE